MVEKTFESGFYTPPFYALFNERQGNNRRLSGMQRKMSGSQGVKV